jgi:tRNA(Ile)-lysidine synthase TilS/MesJ
MCNIHVFSAGRFEGDIANHGLNADNVAQFVADGYDTMVMSDDGTMRNAIRNQYLMWPERRVPYTISSQYSSYSYVACMRQQCVSVCARAQTFAHRCRHARLRTADMHTVCAACRREQLRVHIPR